MSARRPNLECGSPAPAFAPNIAPAQTAQRRPCRRRQDCSATCDCNYGAVILPQDLQASASRHSPISSRRQTSLSRSRAPALQIWSALQHCGTATRSEMPIPQKSKHKAGTHAISLCYRPSQILLTRDSLEKYYRTQFPVHFPFGPDPFRAALAPLKPRLYSFEISGGSLYVTARILPPSA
jgi:hypothetical protein